MTKSKRVVDVVVATFALLLLWPLFAVIAICIASQRDGGVFFRQTRVGCGGKAFRMWKFRTMISGAERAGGQLTVGDDPRVTRVGRWLRRAKLDELPQLLNVLHGDMSLVGPRPEVPRYVAMLTTSQRQVLDLTPGITDPASLKYFDESAELAAAADAEEAYVERVMPEKIRLNLEYAAQSSVWKDLGVIWATIVRVVRAMGRRDRRTLAGTIS
ncbi:MAG TPA: sugar transferase [Gemmatimonadaceae bacterium]|nr:sugar transferase [Gemmatimonadaceae bacterium]